MAQPIQTEDKSTAKMMLLALVTALIAILQALFRKRIRR